MRAPTLIRASALVVTALLLGTLAAGAGPTPEEYAAHVGGDAKILRSGELKLDGYKMTCGQRPTVLDVQA